MRQTILVLAILLAPGIGFAQTAVIEPSTSLPITTTGSTKIVVQYVNPFRFQYSAQISSSNVTGPTPPVTIAPGASTAGSLPALIPKVVPAPGAQPTIGDMWKDVNVDLSNARTLMLALQQQIELNSGNAAAEQSCYKVRLQYYSTWRLDAKHKSDLATFAKANATPVVPPNIPNLGDPTTACAITGDDSWPFYLYKETETKLYVVQSDILKMTFSADFAAWDVNGQKTAYDAATAAATSLNTELQTFAVGGTIANNFVNAVNSNAGERALLNLIAVATDDSPFQYILTVNCSNNWYGRGRTDVINIHYTDLSAVTPSDTSIQVSSSSCLTPGTVSTGIGMSFLHNTEYNFVSGIDPKNPGSTISVIGTTTDQPITPIYAVQYNIGLKDWPSGVGVQAAVGAGLGSSSGTAIVEPLAGFSISIRHRAFFISPMMQIGRRESLLRGYSIGFPEGNGLTAIPTNTSWKPGFALIFSFAVAQ